MAGEGDFVPFGRPRLLPACSVIAQFHFADSYPRNRLYQNEKS
jgi:hypothetical protein